MPRRRVPASGEDGRGRFRARRVGAGRSRLRLDTRGDLVEARRLYERLGYREVPPFNAGRYAEHWLEKTLTRPVVDPSE